MTSEETAQDRPTPASSAQEPPTAADDAKDAEEVTASSDSKNTSLTEEDESKKRSGVEKPSPPPLPKKPKTTTTTTSAPDSQGGVVRYTDHDFEKDEDDDTLRPPCVVVGGVGGRSVDFPMGPVASHLLCRLCFGFYREPYTIAECLHTFCKSCLLQHFHSPSIITTTASTTTTTSTGTAISVEELRKQQPPSLATTLPEVPKAPPTPMTRSSRRTTVETLAATPHASSTWALSSSGSSSSSCCPLCEVDLGTDPMQLVLHDRTMEELVGKLFPSLRKEQDANEGAFYRQRGIPLKKEFLEEEAARQEAESPSKQPPANESLTTPANANGQGTNEQAPPAAFANNSSSGTSQEEQQQQEQQQPQQARDTATTSNSATAVPADEMDFRLLPMEEQDKDSSNNNAEDVPRRLPRLEMPLLRTTGRMKVSQLKKYLLRRLQLQSTYTPDAVEVLCNGDRIGDELSLTFVRRTRWLHPTDDLRLHYRLTQDGLY